MQDSKHELFSELLEFIATAQFIEEGLKFYLYRCERIVSEQLKNKIPFRTNDESISNSPLGRLIEKYRQFSENDELIDRLRKFKPMRDKIVHAGFVKIYRDRLDEYEITQELDNLKTANEEANELMDLLFIEAERIEKAIKKL
jgi:hypothetical protein